MSARTMALKFATKNCPLNKIPNTTKLPPEFNYVNLTDAQLHAIRVRKGYGISNKQRYANLRLGRCIEKNTQRGQFVKNTRDTFSGSRQLQRRKAATETPQQFQVPAPALNEVEIREGGLKGRVFGLGFVESNYKTIEDAQVGCEPSKYVAPGFQGRIGRGTVKNSKLFEGGEVAKHRGGQMIASQRPPITVTNCIGFGKLNKRRQRRRRKPVINPETGEEIDCDALVGSGNAGFGDDGACSDGFGDIFEPLGNVAPDDGTEGSGATVGGVSASGIPQETIVQPPGEIIIPVKTKCNEQQRALDLQTKFALARAGFGGAGSGTGVGSFDFSCVNPDGAPSGFPCGVNSECCSDNCDLGTNTCV